MRGSAAVAEGGDGERLSLPKREGVGDTDGDVAVVVVVVAVIFEEKLGESSLRRWQSSSCWSCNRRYSRTAKSRLCTTTDGGSMLSSNWGSILLCFFLVAVMNVEWRGVV